MILAASDPDAINVAKQVGFGIIAFLMIVAAINVVSSKNMVRAALSLVLLAPPLRDELPRLPGVTGHELRGGLAASLAASLGLVPAVLFVTGFLTWRASRRAVQARGP